jgi:hypothetical protein
MIKKELYILIFVFMTSQSSLGAQSEAEEYSLKAAFLYNFTSFIEWKNNSEADAFVIGIIGTSPIEGPLQEIARSKIVNNKKIIIRSFNKPEDISFCNILFISANASYPLNAILSNNHLKNTLTVTEKKNYALEGSCINFVVLEDKIKFETNLSAIENAGLKISAQLLKLAIIVN